MQKSKFIGDINLFLLADRFESIQKRAKANHVEAIVRGNVSRHEESPACQKSDNLAKPIAPVDTKKEIAKIAQVSHDTVAKVKKIEAIAPRFLRYLRNRFVSFV